MRLRTYPVSLRKCKKILTRKQKMDSRRRGKRKSPSQDIIFEVSDNDISSGNSEDECQEPEAKISKIDGNTFRLKLNELANLQNNKETVNVEISVNQERENLIEISEHISVSNSSAANSCGSGSDIIVISEDNIDVLNDSEEYYVAPRAESIENSEGKSVDSSEIIDITDENPVDLTDQGPESLPSTETIAIPVHNDSPRPLTIAEAEPSNLEEGELEDSHIEIQIEEPIDVTSLDIEEAADEVDTTTSDPCIRINFRDENIAELYKSKFLKFLQQFVEFEVENSENLCVKVQRDTTLNPTEWVVLDETMCLNDSKEIETSEKLELPPVTIEKTPKKKRKKKNKKEKDLFILDTNPSQGDNDPQFTKYLTKFQIDINEKTTVKEESLKVSTQTCFNCDNNHAIKDCPLPKDFARINAARQRFKAQKQTARYHIEEEQKYSHLKPGKISDKLREALSLRKNQTPPFIYHMRRLGYPPGWLEEAKFIHSNLAMFDSEGNNVRASMKKTPGLDPEKIVNYPGFNVPLEDNMKDEFRQYRVPPYSETFSKQAMIEFYEKHFAKEQDDLETCDMDLDTTFGEKGKNTLLQVPEEAILVNPLINDLKEMDSNMSSPSLTDLEKQKENLLAALEENSSSNPKSVETTEDPENSLDQDKSKSAQAISEKALLDKPLVISVDKPEEPSTPLPSPPLNTSVNCVKTSSFGTPILKSSSPYCRLPNPDNFMKDVSPVINFENLPNSTGKYEQMTGVLQKVRNTLKGLQNCKS